MGKITPGELWDAPAWKAEVSSLKAQLEARIVALERAGRAIYDFVEDIRKAGDCGYFNEHFEGDGPPSEPGDKLWRELGAALREAE